MSTTNAADAATAAANAIAASAAEYAKASESRKSQANTTTPSIETRHAHLNRLVSYRSSGDDQIAVIKMETGSGLVNRANMKNIERDLDWSSAAGHIWLQQSGSDHDIETIWVDARWFEESSDKAAGELMDYELIIANDLVLDEGVYEQVLNESK